MKPHRTDGVSLTFALIFMALVVWWLLAQLVDLPLPAVGWFVAGALIFIGALGLLGALRSGRREQEAPPPPAEEPVAVPVSGVPAELHADIVRELLTGPQLPYLPPEPAVESTAVDPLPPTAAERGESRD
jgi:hypothetical protein